MYGNNTEKVLKYNMNTSKVIVIRCAYVKL